MRLEHVRRLEEIAHLKQALATTGAQAASAAPAATPPAPVEALPADLPLAAAPTEPQTAGEPPEGSQQARMDDLIRLIASTGLARMARLREQLTEAWGLDPRSGSFRAVVDAALKAGLIEEQAIQADWRGAPKSSVVTLTRAGRLRAVTVLDTPLVAGELEPGQVRGYPLELSVLVLKAAEVLRAAGYRRVQAFPTEVVLTDGQPYHPPLSAVEGTGEVVFIECERGLPTQDRSEHWLRAVEAAGQQHLGY